MPDHLNNVRGNDTQAGELFLLGLRPYGRLCIVDPPSSARAMTASMSRGSPGPRATRAAD